MASSFPQFEACFERTGDEWMDSVVSELREDKPLA